MLGQHSGNTCRENTSPKAPKLLPSSDVGREGRSPSRPCAPPCSCSKKGVRRLSTKADSVCCSETRFCSCSSVGRRMEGKALETCGERANPPSVDPKPSNLGRLEEGMEPARSVLSRRCPAGTEPKGAMPVYGRTLERSRSLAQAGRKTSQTARQVALTPQQVSKQLNEPVIIRQTCRHLFLLLKSASLAYRMHCSTRQQHISSLPGHRCT